jgi:signal transduction histidine kinase
VDNFQKLSRQVRWYLFGWILVTGIVVASVTFALTLLPGVNIQIAAIGGLGASLMLALLVPYAVTPRVLEPLHFLWQSIIHVAPGHTGTAAPNMDKSHLGKELVSSLILQVYQFASQQDGTELAEHRKEITQAANVVTHLPLPLFVFNKQQLVVNASEAGLQYCEKTSADVFGKPLFESLNLEFPSERTLEKWIEECEASKVTDTAIWERVRVVIDGQKEHKQCDIAAYYNRDNPSGTEFIVTLFDRTVQYSQDDSNLSFVALAVHELRTPLTMLRGYIEVFEDELGPTLNAEMQDFMRKMRMSAQQLTSFINNILNVSRVEENALTLQLTEQHWDEVIKKASEDIALRAQVHGKTVEYEIAPNLPTVGVDRTSIYEVMSNLLDNAIKYSGQSKRIIVHTDMGKDGMVHTTIQDFGVGIPDSVLPNLFEKFYRNHRTRSQIGGTGLGLFLSKAIINAHGGQIWAESKEGQGSTFGFTLLPYSKLADELKAGNKDIVRGAHGWIKNHSLYRR